MQGTLPEANLPSSTFHLDKILSTFPFLKTYLCSIQSWLITSTKWHPTCVARIGWLFGSPKNKGSTSIGRLSELLTTYERRC